MTTSAIAYLRVSTSQQANGGVSLEAQKRKVELYAELHDIKLVDVIVDAGKSASSLDRPGLNQALSLLQDGKAQALIVTKLDRLTRSVKDLGSLLEGIFSTYGLMSVNESIDTRSAAGRLVLNILCSVAQWERQAVSERTKAALDHKRSKGEFCGGRVPFGSQKSEDGKFLEENEKEMAVIVMARAYQVKGLSLSKIAIQLNEDGILNRGRKWHKVSIHRMLKGKF